MKLIQFSDGYVSVLPPTKTKIAWRIEVWKRRGNGHVMADHRRRLSERAAISTAAELAQFWDGPLS